MSRRSKAFHTTRWSVVRAAGSADSSEAHEALSVLCQEYWYPLYAFVRRSGCSADEAQDITQGFFARLLEKRDFDAADPRLGRFRTYLLGALKHFLHNERDRARALRRGGGQAVVSIDFPEADRRYRLQAAESENPERHFERQWALAMLDGALQRVRLQFVRQGKEALFERLRPAILGDETAGGRRALAESMGMTEGALNVALHRMRRTFRESLRHVVSQTVSSAEEVSDELKTLLKALER